jgi:hypothetical protein
MLQCRKCKATWPDSLYDEWGQNQESAGYGSTPTCVNIVTRGNAQEVCRGPLMAAEDPEDAGQLFLLSPIGDNQARDKAARHNRERTDALRNGR